MQRENVTLKLCVWGVVLAFSLAMMPMKAHSGDLPENPIDQMVIVFKGSYSHTQIKERLDKALQLYDLPKTNENYSRAGSVLVVLRKECGHREMDILSYMIRSHVPGVKMDFPSAAGLAAVFLSTGER